MKTEHQKTIDTGPDHSIGKPVSAFFKQKLTQVASLGNGCRILLSMLVLMSLMSLGGAQTLLLSGNDWKIKDIPNEGGSVFCDDWIPATVPGNIQADLETSRLIKPLWYGLGDARLPEVAHRDWWYQKDFKVPENFAGQHLTLTFDGVDMQCEVWLNDQKLGQHSGMFERFSVDATAAVRPGQMNSLKVRITSMPQGLRAIFPTSDDRGGAQVGPALIAMRLNHHGLKSATNCAWDWSVGIYTLGIWKDVRLEASRSVHVEQIGVLATLNPDYTKADLRVLVDVDGWSKMPVKVSVKTVCNDSKAETSVISQVTEGKNHLEIPLTVDKPLLWWPLGHGDQPLYDLVVEISHPDNGTILHQRSTRYGIRDITWGQVPGAAANFPNPMKLMINGRQIRQLGSNLLPPDALFGRMNERGLSLLQQAHDANINCLRLWGGGVILTEEMYNRADELGIMLMQEFPLANQDPQTDPAYLTILKETAVNVVKQVRNHPCIVEWSGGNEMPTFSHDSKHPALLVLRNVVKEHDTRFLRATEDDVGSGAHGTYTYVYHTKPAPHLSWLGAGGQNLYQRYDATPDMRLSEFGTNSPANLEVWQRTIPPASQWPLANYEDPVLIRKNVFHGALYKENWLHKEITEDLFGPLDGLEQLVPAGQFLGAEGLRYAMDAMRRKGEALGGGFMSWNYNEPWPNGAGSYMIDYDGRPLMNYHFTKQALSQVSLSLKYASLLFDPAIGLHTEVFLVSDAPAPVANVKWNWVARDCKGTVLAEQKGIGSINPIEVKSLGKIHIVPTQELKTGPLFVELQLHDANDQLISERLHVFGPAGITAPLAGLLRNQESDSKPAETASAPNARWMPVARTSMEAKSMPVHVENDQEILELVIKNSGSMTALFCEPHPMANYRTDITIDNNYCFIPPGESRSITIRSSKTSASQLSLAQTGWRITCWNSDPFIIEPTSDLLLSLGRKDDMCREFAGYAEAPSPANATKPGLKGRMIDPAQVHYLLDKNTPVEIGFDGTAAFPDKKALLRIHTSDQSLTGAMIRVELNGKNYDVKLPAGYGLQKETPAQLAQAKTIELAIPREALKLTGNLIKILVLDEGWFSWDALDLSLQNNE